MTVNESSGEQHQETGLALCGEGHSGRWGPGMGCGEPILTLAGLYRCAQCDTAMHGDCLRRHFGQENGRLLPTQMEAFKVVEDLLRQRIEGGPLPYDEWEERVKEVLSR